MANSDEDRVLDRIGRRLFTLRVTVVLAPDLDGARAVGLEEKDAHRHLRELWDAYVPEPGRDEGGLEDGPGTSGTPSPSARSGPRTYEELVRHASALLEPPDEPVTDEAGGGADPGRGGRVSGDRAQALHRGVLQRIATLGQALGTPADAPGFQGLGGRRPGPDQAEPDAVEQVDRRLALDRAVALGTYPVLLETFISIDGDVTTRLNEAWLDSENDPDHRRLEAVLKLQAMGIQTAVSWWSNLIDLVGRVGKTLFELVLRR